MKTLRASLIAVVLCLLTVGISFSSPSGAAISENGSNAKAAAAACGKCGDGKCVRQCGETAKTCPVDCGVASATE